MYLQHCSAAFTTLTRVAVDGNSVSGDVSFCSNAWATVFAFVSSVVLMSVFSSVDYAGDLCGWDCSSHAACHAPMPCCAGFPGSGGGLYVGCGSEGESTVPVTGIVCTNITASSNSAGDSAGADNCPPAPAPAVDPMRGPYI
jgi:hypothetical protein